jgi:DHA1 family inner membrane transport protein
LEAARISVRPAVLVAIASSTAVFTATPFMLQPIAEEFGVSVGAAGFVSTAQLAGFVLSSWASGRFLRPIRAVFVAIPLLGFVANLASAAAPTLAALSGARFVSGLSLGLAAWFAWQDAFGDTRKTGDVAVTGPLVGVVLAPTIAIIVDRLGLDALFVVLAIIAASPIVFVRQIPRVDRLRPHSTRHAATRAARAILVALGLITLAGSSVFVYAAAIGTELNDLSPLVVSIAFSCNALVAIPAAKWSGSRGSPGLWFAAISILAFVLPAVHVAGIFLAALVGWGFLFFMGIPAAFGLLAARSRFPEERAGDAQAIMALGRVFGPLVGGAFLASGATTQMGIVAAAVMLTGAGVLMYVDRVAFTQR